jgi:biotin carboxyl carrier protein
MLQRILIFSIPFFFIISCKSNTEEDKQTNEKSVSVVKIGTVSVGKIQKKIKLFGTSVYLQKNTINSPITGFILKNTVHEGSSVVAGQTLFELETEENRALSKIDSNYKITSSTNGFVTQVFKQAGVFVQKGEGLCNFSNTKNVVFRVSVPFEIHSKIDIGKKCEIRYSDEKCDAAWFCEKLNTVDANSQNEIYFLKTQNNFPVPEGLNVDIIFTTENKENAQILPVSAVLSNENMNRFWVMKLLNDSVVVKVPITIGIQNKDSFEILNPIFSQTDRLIFDGNYGLEDSSVVKISK